MKKTHVLIPLLVFFLSSCIIQSGEPILEDNLDDFSFPENFNFTNSKTIEIDISGLEESKSIGIIDVYINGPTPIHIGKFGASNHTQLFEVPIIEKEILLIFDDGSERHDQVYNIENNQLINWNLSGFSSVKNNGRTRSVNSTCTDKLYAVENSFGGFWEIDLTNDDYANTSLPNLQGGGSIACALDQENELMYYNANKTLYAFNVVDGTFSTIHQGNPFNASYPRLAFNDGKFYMSNTNNLFVVDATTNEVKQQYTIKGIINANGGGDLDFASDGTLYLSCFSGLYKFISFEGNTATVVRISAENFPYKLTSMAIDREDRIFVGTSDANAHLIEMNKEDGSFRIVNTYDHKINDLTAWRCATQDLEQIDSDEDGIIDELDDHPNDPEAAFDVFTPSEIGYGTLAFEDMWPTHGDYDFNDLVLNYRFANVMNSANKSVRLEMELKILAAGATFKNGFGIELPIEPSLIESVEGAQLTENIISTDSKGLELNQSKAVIIPFDNILGLFNAGSLVNTRPENGFIDPVIINITVHFKEPVDSQTLDNAPYNPFIFVNGDRSREVHLKNNPPTDLSDNSLFGTGEDYTNLDKGNSYVNQHNVPWAINMIHNFRFPVEKTRIDKAYNHLVTWGKSNGTMYADWYKDNAGYRNTNKIVFINK